MYRSTIAIVLGLLAATVGWTANTNPEAAPLAQFEQVQGIRQFGRLDDWHAIDRDTLIVWATPSRPYLVELSRASSDLRFVEAIGVTSTFGTVRAKLDSVLLRGLDYPIKAIYKLSRDDARELQLGDSVWSSS